MNKQTFMAAYGLTEGQYTGTELIKGCFELWHGETTLPAGFCPNVSGEMLLQGVVTLPEGFTARAGGDVYLTDLKETPKGFAPVVAGSLLLGTLEKVGRGFAPKVGGNLISYQPHSNLQLPKDAAPEVEGLILGFKLPKHMYTEAYADNKAANIAERHRLGLPVHEQMIA